MPPSGQILAALVSGERGLLRLVLLWRSSSRVTRREEEKEEEEKEVEEEEEKEEEKKMVGGLAPGRHPRAAPSAMPRDAASASLRGPRLQAWTQHLPRVYAQVIVWRATDLPSDGRR